MKHSKIAVSLLLGVMAVAGPSVRADDAAPAVTTVPKPDPKVQQVYDQMMAALETDDFANFVKPLDENMTRLMTKNLFDGVHVMFGPRFDKGYTPEYLCEMKKGGETVYLWKLSFKDGGDDMLLQFAMKDNKVSGFRFL